jgi:hypothetical protein
MAMELLSRKGLFRTKTSLTTIDQSVGKDAQSQSNLLLKII